MSLLWFILLVGIISLAVDTINGLRNRTMLQATADADAAALGGAIDLPGAVAAVTSAAAYSADSMPVALYGSVLKAGVPEEQPRRPAMEDHVHRHARLGT
jgi:hypothetical protein